ncbi:hypothetical protein GOBAR_AA07389 [Gossypium barbadense]|uniref:Uncharacterized protein n=1 Tax=Gossypium barbadense TaxID=3634 RepID=A0A2P5YCD3_GOSBA|nr:hypothetical protein GOBAR_AA07389 [Gossypium barbadense]
MGSSRERSRMGIEGLWDSVDLCKRRIIAVVGKWVAVEKEEECLKLIEKEWSRMEGLRGKTVVKLRKLKEAIKKWYMEDENTLERSIMESEARIKAIGDISENRKLAELEMDELKQLNIEAWCAKRVPHKAIEQAAARKGVQQEAGLELVRELGRGLGSSSKGAQRDATGCLPTRLLELGVLRHKVFWFLVDAWMGGIRWYL